MARIGGFTKVELATAVGALGMVLGAGLWWFQRTDLESQQTAAQSQAQRLLNAATDWKREHAGLGCPSVSRLIRDAHWDKSDGRADPWGKRYRISCRDETLQVRSGGLDRRFSTEDDIFIRKRWNG